MPPQPDHLLPPVTPTMDPRHRTALRLGGLACGGCLVTAALATMAVGLFVALGFGFLKAQIEESLRDNPTVIEHLGEIDDLDLDLRATLLTLETDEFVFEAQGSKANGTLHVISLTTDAEKEEVVAGTLRLESGEEFNLFPDREGEVEARP